MLRFALLMVSTLAVTLAVGGERLANWMSRPIADIDTALFLCANRSDDTWRLSLVDGEILADRESSSETMMTNYFATIEGASYFPLDRSGEAPSEVERVSDGFLVAYNNGEWGGAVVWVSSDFARQYEISRHQVIKFIRKGADLYALAGLSHLGISHGELIHFRRSTDGRWTATEVAELREAPSAHLPIGEDSILVITETQLLRVWFDGRVATLYTGGRGFSPIYSFVRTADGTLYLASMGTVIRLTPTGTTYQGEWLFPASILLNCETRGRKHGELRRFQAACLSTAAHAARSGAMRDSRLRC